MAALAILKYPAPFLKRKSLPLEAVNAPEKALLDDMLETMYLNKGIGLSAPQAGVLKRAIVVDAGEGPVQLINPVITKKTGSERGEEGCLSFPGILVTIKRAKKIRYKGLDKNGTAVEREAEGLLARALQHEIDHLDGRLIIDYANPVKRIFLKRRVLKAVKAA